MMDDVLMLSVPFYCRCALPKLGQTNSYPSSVYPPPTYTHSHIVPTPCSSARANTANRLDVFVSYLFGILMLSYSKFYWIKPHGFTDALHQHIWLTSPALHISTQ